MGEFKVTPGKIGKKDSRFTTLNPPDSSSRFKKSPAGIFEIFGDDVLFFNAATLRLHVMNAVSFRIYKGLCSGKPLESVAADIQQDYDERYDTIFGDVVNLAGQWETAGLIERDLAIQEIEERIMNEKKYVAEPVVSCREEEPEGAILYKIQTDMFQVINPMGLDIWKSLAVPKSIKELAYEIVRNYEDVPVEDVSRDIEEFLRPLVKIGFIREMYSE
jgi:predicted transcriptional regulator